MPLRGPSQTEDGFLTMKVFICFEGVSEPFDVAPHCSVGAMKQMVKVIKSFNGRGTFTAMLHLLIFIAFWKSSRRLGHITRGKTDCLQGFVFLAIVLRCMDCTEFNSEFYNKHWTWSFGNSICLCFTLFLFAGYLSCATHRQPAGPTVPRAELWWCCTAGQLGSVWRGHHRRQCHPMLDKGIKPSKGFRDFELCQDLQ